VAKTAQIRGLGASPAVVDALDGDAIRDLVRRTQPEVIIHQLTALPQDYTPAKRDFYDLTSRLRFESTAHLMAAARRVGTRRFIYQSICFMGRPEGPQVLDESAPVWDDAPEPFGDACRKTLDGERMTTQTEGIEGVVLRYGQFYGPGTYFAPDGYFARQARRRMLPIVGDGGGVFSFLHVDDAAGATVAALACGTGIYNVADSDPAPVREWLPVYCAAIGAPRPWRSPEWLAGIAAGRLAAKMMVALRGADSSAFRRATGWMPQFESWREGFSTLGTPVRGHPVADDHHIRRPEANAWAICSGAAVQFWTTSRSSNPAAPAAADFT
jgi:nucleoside-diphosphate-sugar epimerase